MRYAHVRLSRTIGYTVLATDDDVAESDSSAERTRHSIKNYQEPLQQFESANDRTVHCRSLPPVILSINNARALPLASSIG